MASMTAWVEVGIGNWRAVRHMFAELKFQGHDIEYLEGPGWLTRKFTYKGDPAVVGRVHRYMSRLAAEQDAPA